MRGQRRHQGVSDVEVQNQVPSLGVADAAHRSTRTLEAHCREVELCEESKIGTVPRGFARLMARPGRSASEAPARRLVQVASSLPRQSSFGVVARPGGFVNQLSPVVESAARRSGSIDQGRGALKEWLPWLRPLSSPAALAKRLRFRCALTTRWNNARPVASPGSERC